MNIQATINEESKFCQEASPFSDTYKPCGQPATGIISVDGLEIPMCDGCIHHSVNNRGLSLLRKIPLSDQASPPRNHNNPPDPIEEVIAEFDDVISEAKNWTDGETVDDEASMLAVDAVIKEFKTYKTALGKAGKLRTDPLHKEWKAEVAAVKVYTEDADIMLSTLVAVVAPYKKKLADEKKAKERAAWEAADKARREAEAKAAAANVADLDARREAAAAAQAAIDAQKAASAQSKDKVKGMRTVTRHEITNMRALVNWIATNDKDAMADFATEYARKNHKTNDLDGVRVWTEKEAF